MWTASVKAVVSGVMFSQQGGWQVGIVSQVDSQTEDGGGVGVGPGVGRQLQHASPKTIVVSAAQAKRLPDIFALNPEPLKPVHYGPSRNSSPPGEDCPYCILSIVAGR